jgi:hypothetical protein
MKTPKPQEHEVIDAIKDILKDEKSYKTSLNWAVNYCRAALDMEGESLRVQCLYILNNIAHWRNPDAKRIRGILKAYCGIK